MEPKGLLIFDPKNWEIVVTLSDILNVVGEGLYWKVFKHDLLFKKEPSELALQMYRDAEKREGGIRVSCEQVREFASCIHQIIDGEVVGFEHIGNEFKWKVTIEMFDSYYWKIFTDDVELYERLKAKLPWDQLLDLQSEYPEIPCPHEHKVHTAEDGSQTRGPPQLMENWDYEAVAPKSA